MKKYFGYEQFRPLQAEIITAALQQRDVLVLMPTGGGKSLCFQIPALISEGLAVVVSPLIALMKDQVEGLIANGVGAAFLNSTQQLDEQQNIEQRILEGDIKLLYVSPEKLLTEAFLVWLTKIKISFFAIDEAHCISAWGHDFRPEYTQLRLLKERFADTPLMALTATADRLTRTDIMAQLCMQEPAVFIASFDRPNLSLTVLPAQNRMAMLLSFLEKRNKQSGIIYCLSRNSTEDIAEKLRKNGYRAAHYHAGMPTDERNWVQENFINDNIPIICATIAFGMGIDKSNVRFVAHYNMPKNMEGYYQEIGRAGRDGLPSDTLLFYSYGDVIKLRNFAEESGQQEIQLAKLERMQQYAEAQMCRRKILLHYFDEPYEKNCGNCDVCRNPPHYTDGTIQAQKALSVVARSREQATLQMVIDILRASVKQELLEKGFHLLKTYGAGRDATAADWQVYLQQLIHLGLLRIAYEDHNYLKITELSKKVLFEGEKVQLVSPADWRKSWELEEAKPAAKAPRQKVRDELFEALRTLRKQIADEANIAPYLVFSDATLMEMAAEKPLSLADMRLISGVGERKLELYGDIFIQEILQFIYQANKKNTTAALGVNTKTISLTMFQSGKDVADIARERNITESTVHTHLLELYRQGAAIDIERIVPKNILDTIQRAIREVGTEGGSTAIFKHLNETCTYEQIRWALMYYNENKN